MNEQAPNLDDSTIQRAKRFEGICDAFESQCSAGNRPSIESFLLRVDGPEKQPLLIELIAIEMHYRRQNGESIAFSEYQTRFPGLSVARLEETIQHSEKAHSLKTPAADQPTIDSRGGQTDRSSSHRLGCEGLALVPSATDGCIVVGIRVSATLHACSRFQLGIPAGIIARQ